MGQPEWKARDTATGTKEVKIGTGSPKATPTTSRTLPSISSYPATRPTPQRCGGSDSSSSCTGRATRLALLASGVAVPNALHVLTMGLISIGGVEIYVIWFVKLATG